MKHTIEINLAVRVILSLALLMPGVSMLALAGAAAQNTEAAADEVFTLIDKRLSLMKPVAHWKFVREVPVEDLEREAVVLDSAVSGAAENGIKGESIRTFFQAQIDSAKDIQNCWIARWNSGDALPAGDPPDLRQQIRPQLLAIGSSMIDSLVQARKTAVDFGEEGMEDFREAVDIECLSDESRTQVYRQLGSIELAK